ncbi:RICIN domain-containing protein [Bradyrhizobium sp. AS23.2]|uniref:ricin-type beta-trefoil lectin domain protein n=1 Tax=Bradyrhizobium sp. AS23.2 TaxID=1680155 RepID=UPI0014305038|nr:RICIN domain-containing protein [Bradyrhizobium sp. AS23.2]
MKIRMLAPRVISALCACTILLDIGAAQAQEPTGRTSQPLVTPNPPIDQQTQEQFGLLTLSNPEATCSASMLNDYWAITAAHCVFSFLTTCPQFAANQISLTANWPGNTKTVQARQVILYGRATTCPPRLGTVGPSDVALLQVGLHDFVRSDAGPMKLDDQRPMANLGIRGYGRGINALAFQVGPVPTPTNLDGKFRWADFVILPNTILPNSSAPPSWYSFPGTSGATVAGGDSGGPSYVQDWDDPFSINRKLEYHLIGVHSGCNTTCLPGQSCNFPNPWTWVSSVSQCTDAAILPLRSQILAAIEAVPPDTTQVGTFPPIPESVLSQKRALYAKSIDEPLVAPPDAAIDVQLTFLRCDASLQGCPTTPDLQQWAYDPATHILLHVPSGKCVNISGARQDAGSPIILYPCSGGANEKWSLVNAATTLWSIKSDLTAMCLQAVPGHAASGGQTPIGDVVVRPPAAALVQMPCDGGNAQLFADVSRYEAEHAGPH